MTKLGIEMRRLRKAQGWTQKTLERMLGLGLNEISLVETGKKRLAPTDAFFERLAAQLGVPSGHFASYLANKAPQVVDTGGSTPTLSSEWLTPRAAAKVIGVGEQMIYDVCERRDLRHTRLGGKNRIRIHRDWLNAWMTQHSVEPKPLTLSA